MKIKNIEIHVSDSIGSVSVILTEASNPKALYVLAHGAGAGMHHAFMERVSQELAKVGISTLRYQFPYMEAGKKRPDSPGVATQAVQAAVEKARELHPELPIFAGGKSFGGRMSSQAASMGKINVDGLIFLGFPLHAPGKASNDRAEHLYTVKTKMLFLQGSRDALAKLEYLEPVIKRLGKNAILKVLEGGDHSFKTRKMDGISVDEIYEWISKNILNFI